MSQPRSPIQGGAPSQEELRLKDSFARACAELWDQSVRTDLIYGKNLTCCGDCLGMFYPSDTNADHPQDQCFVVGQVCAKQGIASVDDFRKALWAEALKLYSKHGRILLPRMAANHEEAPKAAQPARDMTSSWYQARLVMLEQEVLNLQSEKSKLLTDKATLESQVTLLMERLLSEKALIEKIRLKADRHLDALHCLLHTEGCGCTGQCEQGPPHHP